MSERVALLGLGRSGLQAALAVRARGGTPVVFDQKEESALAKPELATEAREAGIELRLGWRGKIDASDFDLLITNPAVSRKHEILLAAVADGLEVVSEVEYAFRIARAPIVAITGTNGKSTTTAMTWLCLRDAGFRARLCGNIYGSGFPEQTLTEAALEAESDEVLVAEISSFQLEWVSRFRPIAAAITTITEDHLDRYDGRFADYAQTKMRIWAAQGPEEFAVARAHDPVVTPPGAVSAAYRGRRAHPQAPQGPTPRVLTFGAMGEHAQVDDLGLAVFGHRIRRDDLPFDEPVNYQNACTALLLAHGATVWMAEHGHAHARALLENARLNWRRSHPQRTYGPTVEDPDFPFIPELAVGLLAFHGLAHRMEPVGSKNGIRVIDNSMCTNPDAVMKSAQSVREPTHLLMGGINKQLDFRPLRTYLSASKDRVYLFGKDAEELNAALGGGQPVFNTMAEAFAAATEAARSGEAIMLAPGCASTDQFRDFVDRGNVFKAIAKEWLAS